MAAGVLNGLSSVSALTLSQPGAIVSLVALGVIAVGTITEISYKAWVDYEEKKHKANMDAINQLHKKHLKMLMIPNGTIIPGLPQIFQFSADAKTVDSLHYNDDEVADIGRVLPHVPIILTRYRQSVLDALLKLKEYYFGPGKDNVITAGVLSYLMNILQNRCLSFVGYDYDITYLRAIIAFINDYASQSNMENSQHFSHLKPVYTSLMDAVQDLEKHKESMSLKELVDETRNACLDESNQLIRLFVQMVIPEKFQNYVHTVTHAELAEGIVRQKYIDSQVWGFLISSPAELNVPNSIFHNWIKGIAKYYLQSLDPQGILNGEKMLRPEELYKFIKWARNIQGQQSPIKTDKKEFHDELNLIYQVFVQSPNFINSKLDGAKKDRKFVIISTDNDLLDALQTMADFVHLIHGVLSLQALCAELSNSIDQLGLNFFDDQNNFDSIFTAFNTIYKVIQTDLEQMQLKIQAISTANENTMRLAPKMQFQDTVSQALQSVKGRVLTLANEVLHYKNKHPQSVTTSVNKALSAAAFFQRMYEDAPQTQIPNRPMMGIFFRASKPVMTETETQTDETAPSISIEQTSLEMKLFLEAQSSRLFTLISKIKNERCSDPQLKTYQNIYNTLRDLKIKSMELLEEENQVPDRVHKAQKTYKLICELYKLTNQFLEQTPDDRINEANAFLKKIQDKLHDLKTKAFVDRHKNNFSKLIYENFGLFQTKTREKLWALESACKNVHTST